MLFHSASCQVLSSSSCVRILSSVKSDQWQLLLVSCVGLSYKLNAVPHEAPTLENID